MEPRVIEARFRYEPLTAQHDRNAFVCGDAALDTYFRQMAMQHQRNRISAVFVQVDTTDGAVNGFYTLASHRIDATALVSAGGRGLPKNGLLPATSLGRLAIRTGGQQRGSGTDLLTDAVISAYTAVQVGSVAVVAEMKTPDLIRFYGKLGFVAIPESDTRVILPMTTIAALLNLPSTAMLHAEPTDETDRKGKV